MKKLTITIAIVLGMGMTLSAQIDPDSYEKKGGLFGRGWDYGLFLEDEDGGLMRLPEFDSEVDEDAPLGSGIAVLTALGAAYLVGKRRKE